MPKKKQILGLSMGVGVIKKEIWETGVNTTDLETLGMCASEKKNSNFLF